MVDTFLWWTGFAAWVLLSWWIVLRHVSNGLRYGLEEAWGLLWLTDFSNPEKCYYPIARHFNNWDKLWLVPKLFRLAFFRGLERSYRWG